MKLNELQTYLETELTYPIDQDAVIDAIGSMELDAPDAEETELIAGIIGSVGQERYRSGGELHATIIGNVGDEYIGRKFYDDRGGNNRIQSERRDEANISF